MLSLQRQRWVDAWHWDEEDTRGMDQDVADEHGSLAVEEMLLFLEKDSMRRLRQISFVLKKALNAVSRLVMQRILPDEGVVPEEEVAFRFEQIVLILCPSQIDL